MKSILQQLWAKRWVRISTLVLAIIMVGLLIFTVLNRKDYKQYAPFTTPLSQTQNFSQLQGNSLYAYNGLAFYKLDLSSNQTTILHTGSRYPTPSQIVWAGDKGALLNFSGSLYDTKVEDALAARGEQVSQTTQQYTWYLNFESNELSFVNTYPMLKNRSVYSPQHQGIYYIPDVATLVRALPLVIPEIDRFSVNFFDIAANKNRVVANKLETVDVIGSFLCANQAACFLTIPEKETTHTDITSVSPTGQVQPIMENYVGRIFSSNRPDLVIRVPNVISDEPSDDDIEGDAAEGEALLYNLETKTEYRLGFDVGNSSLFSNFDGKNFYIFDTAQFATPGQPNRYYRAGVLNDDGKPSTKNVPITKVDESQSETGVYLDFASYGSGGKTLLDPVSGNSVLFGEVGQTQDIRSLPPNDVQALIEPCQSDGRPEIQYFNAIKQFRVLIPQTDDWRSKVADLSACMTEKGLSAMVGYSYQFVLTDPISGRMVSG